MLRREFIKTSAVFLSTLKLRLVMPTITKKLIAFQEFPVPSYMAANYATLDQAPIDGFVFDLPFIHPSLGEKMFREYNFAKYKISKHSVRQSVDYLKATGFNHVTNNFIIMNARPAAVMDWFDDEWLAMIIENFRLAFIIATECNLPGICFDAEEYSGPVWKISNLSTWGSYSAEAHREAASYLGMKIAQVMRSINPDLKILLTIPNLGFEGNTDLELYSYFINGICDGLDYNAQGNLIVGEENTYQATNDNDFSWYNQAHFTSLSNPALSANWATHLSRAFSMSPSGGTENWSYIDPSLNFLDVAAFQTVLELALTYSDEFATCYTREAHWFATQSSSGVLSGDYKDAARLARFNKGMPVW